MGTSMAIVNMAIHTQTSLKIWKRVDNIIIQKRKDSNSLETSRIFITTKQTGIKA
jgi:hypothetical protein